MTPAGSIQTLILFHHSVQAFKSVPFAHYKVWKTTRSPLSFRVYLVRGSHAEGVNFIAPVLHPHLPPLTHTHLTLSPPTDTLPLSYIPLSPVCCFSISLVSPVNRHSLTHSREVGLQQDHWIISLADRYTSSLSHRGDTHTIPGSTWGVVCHAFPSTTLGSPAKVSYGGTGKNHKKLS